MPNHGRRSSQDLRSRAAVARPMNTRGCRPHRVALAAEGVASIEARIYGYALLYFANPISSWVAGQVLFVNGGDVQALD